MVKMILKRQYLLPCLVLSIGGFLISVWIFLIIPELKNNTDEFSYFVSYVGHTFDATALLEGKLPTPIYTIYKQDVTRISGNILEISTRYTNYNAITDEILWDTNQTSFVDKNTGLYIEPSNTYFQFPQNTQKQNYLAYLYDNGDPQPFVFEEETYLNGLKVYRFSCELTADLSEFYPNYSPAKVFSDYQCNGWIEPVTGDEIQFEENWMDYLIENGEKIPVEITYTRTSEFSKTLSVENVINKIRLFDVYDRILPILFSVIVIISFLATIFYIKYKQSESEYVNKKI